VNILSQTAPSLLNLRSLLALGLGGPALLGVIAAGCAAQSPQSPDGTETATVPAEQVAEAKQADTATCVTFSRGGTGDIADATIDPLSPSANYGSGAGFIVAKSEQALLRADISSIPAGSTVSSATLKLYAYGGGDDTNPVNFHAALAAWSESTVTYASFAESFSAAVSGSLTGPSGRDGAYESVDLTALTQAWVAGTSPNYGVLLETVPQNKKYGVDFASGEAGGSLEPTFTVCYTAPNPCASNPCDNGGTCTAAGSSYTCACTGGFTGTNCQTAPAETCPCDFGSGWTADYCEEFSIGQPDVQINLSDASGNNQFLIEESPDGTSCFGFDNGNFTDAFNLTPGQIQACLAALTALDTANLCGQCVALNCGTGNCNANPSGNQGGSSCPN
jgi:hypothetical protein